MKPNHNNAPLMWCMAILLIGVCACRSVAPSGDGPPVPTGPLPESSDEIVLSRVDGAVLTLSDALDTFLSSHAGHGSLVQGEGAIRELTGRIIERQLFLTEAATLGIPEQEDVLEVVDLRRLELAEGLFWKREVKDRVEVSDQEVDDFYSRTDMALTVFYMEVREQEAAVALRQQILDGADFQELAKVNSVHASRDFGGLMGYVRRGDLERVIEDEIFALENEGDMTPVVPTEKGFAFARFKEKTTNPSRPAREVALPQIRSVLEERAEEALTEEVEARIRSDAGVTVDEALLSRAEVLSTTNSDTVVARAAGEELTFAELREILNLDAVRANADEEVVHQALVDVAEDWARGWALKQAILAAGLTEDPEITDKVERYHEDVQLGWLYRNYIYVETAPTDDEVRAYYDQHLEDLFTTPAELRLAYIVVKTEEEARGILARVENGEDFGEIAKQESIDATSAGEGGKTAWVREGQIIPAVEVRAFAMEVGAYDGPIESEYGYFVLHLLARKERAPVSFDVAKRMATSRLLDEKKSDAHQFWAKRLRDRADVVVDEAGVRLAVAWLEREAEREAARAAEEAARKEAEAAMGPVMLPTPAAPDATPEDETEVEKNTVQEETGGSR